MQVKKYVNFLKTNWEDNMMANKYILGIYIFLLLILGSSIYYAYKNSIYNNNDQNYESFAKVCYTKHLTTTKHTTRHKR